MGFGNIGLFQLIIVLAIVLLLFGGKRLKNLGADLGNAIKGFKDTMDDDSKASKEPQNTQKSTIDRQSSHQHSDLNKQHDMNNQQDID